MKIATTNAATIKRPRTITPADKGVPPPGQLTGVYDDIQNTTRPPLPPPPVYFSGIHGKCDDAVT